MIQADLLDLSIIVHLSCQNLCSLGNFAGSGSRPVLFIKKYLCRLFLGRQAHREHLANQQSTNNEYNQSYLLIDSVLQLADKNNDLIKLIIPLNKMGLLPGPMNFPVIRIYGSGKVAEVRILIKFVLPFSFSCICVNY